MATKTKEEVTDDFGLKPTKTFDMEHRLEAVKMLLDRAVEEGLIDKWETQGEGDTLLYKVHITPAVLKVMRLPTVESFLYALVLVEAV